MKLKHVLAATALFAVIATLGWLFLPRSGDPTQAAIAADTTSSSSAAASAITELTDEHLEEETPSDRSQWEDQVARFATAWGNGKVGKTAWLQGLKPYVGEFLLEDLKTVEAYRLPYGNVVATSIVYDSWQYVEFRVSYDTDDKIAVQMPLASDGSWEIVKVSPLKQ